ncbi:proliferation marker protein Ki-67 isoform X1 [Cygnus olor]|uniref:proliferation marker protein Ki-67 isoform X1 n=1 Tax=Cygnus olor TaxID=8869 RepID=UPI001ADE2A61|nr:proliferation marker protein Ki-67 isoform X1 [Cygnus olor]XP_040419009.1 proliferation marker protein Ki-67 isoform X1 [Cygnus olor]XP_040419010.1 proliferation marker protein Ki-67 isoform X1 [Cygnus olor]
MPLFGKIIVIKRNGTDGIHFPLTASSCLFGRLNCLQDLNSFIQLRRTECDIRIQLPQVSKEHCKIEVNENEEAILTNLSTVNPTQLNGSCFQQPVPLQHGDVLTIIDRSFRFEYPLQSTPRKRRSRSLKDETRQVLHVQQVAEVELLHKQTSGSKRSSDHSECEEQNADENKQSTEENMSKALPVKLQTPKSSYKTKQSIKKENEMSPFSRLYETLKHEIKVKKTLQEGNVPEKAEKEGGKGALQEPSARIASSCDLVSPAKEKEIGISENNEEYKMKQEVISSEFNQISTVGSATKKCFTRSPQTSISKEVTKGIGKRSNLQDHKEVSTPGKSKGTEVTAKTPKPSKENDSNAACLLQPCSIERLGYADEVKIYNSAITAEKIAQTTNMTKVSEVDKHVSTPTPRRKSPRSCFTSPTKEATGVDSVNIGTPTTRGGVSLERKSFSEISAEIQREDSVCRNDSLQQLPLAENKCLKQRRNSKQHTPRKSAEVEVLKEICDQTNVDSKKRDSESPASNSKSPRRNVRQSKEFVNKSIHSETPISGELKSELASPASEKSGSGRKRSRPRTSELRTEKSLETNAVKEHHNKTVDSQDSGTQQDLATNVRNRKSDLENASVPRPHRFSSKRRSSGSANVLEGNEAVSEMSVSGLLAEEESGKTKRVSQKRKSGDLLPQPLGKTKRVSFGGHLSPELFDKSLPPNSPLKRGAIPARLSLPFGDSPRAVLKKAQGLKHFAVQELSVRLQKEKMSPKNLPAQVPPAAYSPDSGKATPELTTSSPAPYTKGRFSVSLITTPSPIAEEQNGVEKDMNTEEKSGGQVQTPTSNHVSQDDNTLMATPNKLTKSSQRNSKKTPMKRSGAVAVINAKRRSGASTANLLVAKSWAEVVKLGVARPQAKAVKKRTQKGRPVKKITESPKTPERKIKGHFSTGHAESPATIVIGRAYSTTVRMAGKVPKVVKNPILKQNLNMDESFTGLGEMFKTPENESGKRSPSSPVHNSDFTPTCTAADVSELHTPEESGEMMVSPLNTPDASEQKLDCQDISYLLIEKESPKSVFDIISAKTPEGRKAVQEEDLDVDSVSIIAEKQASQVKLASKRKTPDQKLESVEVVSGIKQLLRTPKKKPKPAEALSGVKRLMKTPKQKPEPVEALSGIKQLVETPKKKPEPVEALSGIKQLVDTPKKKPKLAEVLLGIKRLMKTPKQKPEPVEALSGIKQLMETPEQKPEPAEALSGIKQLMETPEQKPEPAEALSGIEQLMETPEQKPEPAEALSGIEQLMETPEQKPEPAEALSGIEQLMETPEQKPEPVEALSVIEQLMETPEQKPEPVEALSVIEQLMETPKQKPEPAEALSGIEQLMETPEQKPEPAEALSGIEQLMETPKQKPEPVEALSGIKQLMETPEEKLEPAEVLSGIKQLTRTPQQKLEPITDENVTGVNLIPKNPKLEHQPVEDMVGVSRIFKTPKEKVEPIEDMFGISRLVQTPREKYHPVDDFVGLKRLMAEPRQKNSDSEVDYVGVKEMFGEETKVRSENVTDPKQEDAVPPCANDSRDYGGNKTVLEDTGNTSQGKDSQQNLSTTEDRSTQRLTRGRSRKTAHPTSIKQCEKDLNLKELQGLEIKSIQEEMGEISTSTSIAKNTGRRKRTNPCMEKEIVSKHPDEKTVETVSLVETQVDTQRPRRGKTKEPKELKHPSEDLESCERGSSVLQKDPANRKQALQEYDINDTSVTEDDQSRKTESVSSSSQDENYQLQTDLKKSENTSDKGSVEDRKEILLLHQKRSRGMKNIENTEALLLPKRGRRARKEQVEQASSEELHGTTRKLRKDQSAKLLQGDEWTSETVPTEESENRTKLEVKITEKRRKSSRNARKHPTEVKADVCGMALENTQNVQKAKETSNETVTETQSPTKNERKVSLGDEAESAQENTTKSSQRLKSKSPSGETDKMPITVLNLESNRSSVQEANRTRNRRGKKDSSEKKADEFAQDVNSLDLMPKCRSETEESSPKESSASSCVKQSHQVMKDQNNTADTSVTTLNSNGVAQSRQKRTRNEQEANEPKQTEILQENQTQNNRTTHRRVRGRKVNFRLEEASSEALGEERNLPGTEEGMTCKRDQHEASENPVQVRRSKRRHVDSIPQATCSTFTKKETLIKDHTKDETFAKDQDPALEAIPSSTEEVPLRGRRRREVAVASQTVSSLSIRKKRRLLEGDDKKMTVKEDQNPALGNNTLQAKANASARDKRKEIDLAAEAKSSASLRRKRGLSETDDKEESTNEEQNMLLESVSCAKEKPLGRGRKKETPPVPHTTNSISLRRKRGLPADNGREEAPKDQNVPEDEPKRGRRNEAAILLEATSSTSAQGKRNLSKESSRKNNRREAKKMISEKPSSEEKIDLSKGYSGKKISIASLAVSSSSLQGLPEDGENETPEEQQGILLEVTQSAKENPSKAGRRKRVPSKSEETSSTFLREKPVLPEDRAQKGVPKEGEGTALENNLSQEKHRQLRNKRKNVQFKSEAATSTSLHDNDSSPENGNISETQCLISTGSEGNNQSGKGKEVNRTQQTSTSRGRKRLLPADDLPPKKLKSVTCAYPNVPRTSILPGSPLGLLTSHFFAGFHFLTLLYALPRGLVCFGLLFYQSG